MNATLPYPWVAYPLLLEAWDSEPPTPEPLPDVEGTFLLNISSGLLGVNEGGGGFEPEVISVEPGKYYVRISGYGRDSGTSPEDGGERYLAQMWPTG